MFDNPQAVANAILNECNPDLNLSIKKPNEYVNESNTTKIDSCIKSKEV